jgi:signal transduction histidine kinase
MLVIKNASVIIYYIKPIMRNDMSGNDVRNIKLEDEILHLDRFRIIGEMAVTIAHEVKNPLTTVKGYLQMLETKDEFKSCKKHIEIMLHELERAITIIDDYLVLGREDSAKPTVQQLNDIIISLYPLINTSAAALSNRVVLELDEIPEIPLNEKEIRQLLLNLTKNGLEAMSGGGMLTIMSYVDDGEVVLGIKDQGKGIDPGIKENLGKPFNTTKEGGSGLGLTVCYKIAEKHGADIAVGTGPDGTVFSVKFRMCNG